ncbi:MAG: NAD(P)-dependent oxidoreductase, partial [Luminiphilus sp.]
LALAEELAAGRLSAGLDVYSEEPLPGNHPLIGVPNVVLVPHLGSATERTRRAMFELAISNLVAGVEGRELPAELGVRLG